jgi:AAA+ ATPase superfamily predicted ATPase
MSQLQEKHPLNPFTNRGVITSPDEFFGREQEIGEIVSRLRAMASLSVVGERRIGKSSLLYHLYQTGRLRIDDPAYRFFYFDLLDARFHTAAGFLRAILQRLELDADAISAGQSLNRNLIAFSDQIEAQEKAGRRTVLCLNEFESAFKHPAEFTEDFYDHLRSQLDHRKFAVVTATRTPLQDLCLAGKLTSPFYNVFTVVGLGVFTDDEVRKFLEHYRHQVLFNEDEIKLINSYLDPHPLKLQILCDFVIRNRERRLAEWALVEEIAKEHGNFFVGAYDPKQLRRAKKWFSLDHLKKVFETLKAGRDAFKGSDK